MSEEDLKRSRRKKKVDDPLERLPPNSIEAEEGVIGSIFLDPKEGMPEAQSLIATSDVFYDNRIRMIYEVLCEMANDQDPIAVSTVQMRLKAFQQLDAVGGLEYLSVLPDRVPTSANLRWYINIVLERYQLRKLIQVATNAIAKAYEQQGEVAQILDDWEQEALKVRVLEGKTVSKNCGAAVYRAVETIQEYQQRLGVISGIRSGFEDLDNLTYGFHPGQMIVIAGRPSTGKTSFAMQVAEHVAIEQNCPVGVYSLEMTEDALALRMVCSRAGVSLRDIQRGYLAPKDNDPINEASKFLIKSKLFINDTPAMTVTQMRADARRMVQRLGIKLFVIDYFQRIKISVGKGDTRQAGFAEASFGIKLMARELGIPVMLLSQISREFERSGSRKPQFSDLKETGSLEEDADIAGFLYRDPEKNKGIKAHAPSVPVSLLIGKNRNGPTGEIDLVFHRVITRFAPASKIDDSDVPQDQQKQLV